LDEPGRLRRWARGTIDWFRANEAWWRAARSGEWDAYYERQYAGRLASADAVPADVAPGAQAAADAEAVPADAEAVPADVAPGGNLAEKEA